MAEKTMEKAWVRIGKHSGTVGASEAARALAIAAHDDACLECFESVMSPSPEYLAWLELRRRNCKGRARIAALGADTARQEQFAEHEMVQAQTPVVNEDGGR